MFGLKFRSDRSRRRGERRSTTAQESERRRREDMGNLGALDAAPRIEEEVPETGDFSEYPRQRSYGSRSTLPFVATRTVRIGDVTVGGSRLSIVSGPALVSSSEDLLRTCVSLATLRQSFIRIDVSALRGEERETMF